VHLGKEKPVVVFAEDGIDDIYNKLADTMPSSINVECVREDKQAFYLRTLKKYEKVGIFCAHLKYGRGWDIKLRQDGVVMVVANKGLISYSQLM
jgi:hypothetical protein